MNEQIKKELENSVNRFSEDEKPVNLKDYSWAGHLGREVWKKYRNIILIYYLIAGVVSVGLGYGMEIIFDKVSFPVWSFGFIIWMWSGIAFPLVYKYFLIGKTYIYEWEHINQRRALHEVLWFKKDLGKFTLSEGIYNKKTGKRYLWWWHDIDKKEYTTINPFRLVEVSIDGRKSTTRDVTSADLAGMPSWRDTVRTYASKKTLGMQQLLQYTAFGIIIGVEVLGLFMLGNRVEEKTNASNEINIEATPNPNFNPDGSFIIPN